MTHHHRRAGSRGCDYRCVTGEGPDNCLGDATRGLAVTCVERWLSTGRPVPPGRRRRSRPRSEAVLHRPRHPERPNRQGRFRAVERASWCRRSITLSKRLDLPVEATTGGRHAALVIASPIESHTSRDCEPAVDGQHRPRDVAACVGCEEDDGSGRSASSPCGPMSMRGRSDST